MGITNQLIAVAVSQIANSQHHCLVTDQIITSQHHTQQLYWLMHGLHVVCKSLQASLLCKKADIRAKWDKMQGQDTVRKSDLQQRKYHFVPTLWQSRAGQGRAGQGRAGQGRAGTHSEKPGVMAHKGGC